MKITYFLDVLSQWCFLSEEALDRVRARFGDAVSIAWRLAWVRDGGPLNYTREQLDWYYARSELVSGRRFVPWLGDPAAGTAHANLAAEAARSLGCGDDRVRRALARAALVEGRDLGRREIALEVAASASGLDGSRLAAAMDEPATLQRIRDAASDYATFSSLGFDQRPTFVLDNAIGDRIVLSGVWRPEPLLAAVDSLLADECRYAEHAASAAPFPG